MKIMKITLFAFLTVNWINASAASFDCNKASTAVEREICSNTQLSALDIKLSNLYRSMLNQSSEKELFRSTQRKWLGDRNKCATDTACLISSYTTRINQLSGNQGVAIDIAKSDSQSKNDQESRAQVEARPTSVKCQSGKTTTDEKISLSKCVGFINHTNKTFNQPLTFPNGPGDFAWNIDKSCGYLSELPNQKSHESAGILSAASGIQSQNVPVLKSTIDACNKLLDFHLAK